MSALPIGPFVRFLIYAASALWANWDSVSRLFARADEQGDALYGYRMHMLWEIRTQTSGWTGTERGESSIAFINVTSDHLDTTWTTGDFTAVENACNTFVTAIASYLSSDFRLIGYRWYAFGPGITSPNPVYREFLLGTPIAGTNNVYAHQMASTVTLRTALRKHWGRFYLPVSAGKAGQGGQIASADVDAIAAAAQTFLHASWTSNGILPVVWDRTRHSAFGCTSIEVDSVPDVIRRRRPQTTNYRKVITA
jgi:hypothetical protein